MNHQKWESQACTWCLAGAKEWFPLWMGHALSSRHGSLCSPLSVLRALSLSPYLPCHLWACEVVTRALVPPVFHHRQLIPSLTLYRQTQFSAMGCEIPSVSGFIFKVFGRESTLGPLCWEDAEDPLDKDLEAAVAKGDRPPQP